MSKEDLEFLIDLQKRMNEQDEKPEKCDFQASPYFWSVAENKIEWGVDYNYCGDEVCFVHDCSQYNTIQECKDFFMNRLDDDIEDDDEEIKEIENITNWSDVEDYNNEHDIEGYIVYGRKNKDIISIYTGCFLTKQACKDHIEKYGYNYSEPHTFAMTADRNPEFERVWNILKKTDWEQLAELKAENERLKEDKQFLITSISKCCEPLPNGVDFDIATDDMRFQIVSNLCDQKHKHIEDKMNLRKQLKEKDEEIARLNAVKVDEWIDAQKRIRSETIKQVCEKIREKVNGFWYFVLEEQKEYFEGNRYVLSKKDFDDILDQIERGEL